MKKNKILLIDANALLHRTFHALPPMISRSGEHTNAVYGFLTIFFKALSEIKPDYTVLCWDEGKKTFRHLEYKEYKANRIKQADELYEQLKRTRQIIEAMGIPNYSSEEFEADDLIGTLSNQSKEKNLDTIILTGDLDSLQLVNDDVVVYTMRKGISDIVIYDAKAVKERYAGLGPEQMIDYKAIRGDASDNISGLPGIGEKTAQTLLGKYGNIDEIFKHLGELSPKIKEVFEQSKDLIEINRHLVTIVLDAPVSLDLKKAELKKYDRELVAKIFQELEFKTLLSRLPYFNGNDVINEGLFARQIPKGEKIVISKNYSLCENLDKLTQDLSGLSEFCFDTETDGLGGDLLGISFAWKEGEACYVPTLTTKTRKEVLDRLKPIFEDEKIKKFGHNLKYDYRIMKKAGVEAKPLSFDSMIASYVLHPHYNSHSMDNLAFVEMGYETMSLSALFDKGDGKKAKIGDMKTVDLDLLSQYSCEDADITLRLVNKFRKELEKNPKLNQLFNEIEMPLVKILADMELLGIKIDKDFLQKMSQKMHREIDDLQNKIYELAGKKFNVNSTIQLKEILFKDLKIGTLDIKKTKTGISTAASELEKLRDRHPIIEHLFRYRELVKLTSTYVDALPKLADEKDRVHTSFNQTLTSTGRLSSSDPNLQNIPIRTEEGRQIRKAFISDEDNVLISIDYSQIELRVAAALAKDEIMISAFKSGKDFHSIAASETLGVSLDKVTSEMRRNAKAISFGMIYGQSPHGLSEATGMSFEEARDYIDKYFVKFFKLKEFLDGQIEEARAKGYVETYFGRRRYIPEINSGVYPVRSAAERTALNTPLQGTAADILKKAMVDVNDKILMNDRFKKDVKLLLTVHDELVFECKKGLAETFTQEAKKVMENVADIGVPLEVEAKSGVSWGAMEVAK